jgi:Ca2+-binding RTX toxin-like protein
MPLTAGPERLANTSTTGDQQAPQVITLTSGSYLVAWDNGNGNIMGQLYSPGGVAINGNMVIGFGYPSQRDYSVTPTADGGFLVAYRSGSDTDGEINVLKYDGGGGRVPGYVQVAHAAGDDSMPAIAATPDGGFAIAWRHGADLELQTYRADGTATAAPTVFASKVVGAYGGSMDLYPRDPSVAVLANGEIVVAWTMNGAGYHGSEAGSASALRFSATGEKLGDVQLSGSTLGGPAQEPTVVATSDGGFAVAWIKTTTSWAVDAGEVIVQKFSAAGVGSTPARWEVGSQYGESVDIAAQPGGGFVVSYSGTRDGDVYLRAFDGSGAAVGEVVTVNSAQGPGTLQWEPDVAVLGDGYAVAWRAPDAAASGVYVKQITGNLADGGFLEPTEISFRTAGRTMTEGRAGETTSFTFEVSRSGDTSGVSTVHWQVGGSGANPTTAADFVGGSAPAGGLTFAAGETLKVITVQVAGDDANEPDETFTLRLNDPSTGVRIGVATAGGTITNDDAPATGGGGQVYTSPGPGSTVTGGAGADTLNASQGSDILTGGGGADVFRWGKEPWSPATVTDFAVGSDKLDLSALLQASGYTGSDPVADKYISLTQQGSDTLVLFDRDAAGTAQQWPNYIIKLQGVTGATWSQLSGGGVTPPPPSGTQLSIRGVEPNHLEGNSGTVSLTFAVERTGATDGTSTVNWSVAGAGSYAADAADFGGSLPTGSLTFAPGETYKTVVVNAVGDTAVEQDEGFSVALTGASGATVGTGSARGMILNDDQVPSGEGGGRVIAGTDTPSTLTGTTGADTITAGRSSDTIVSGDGADLLVFRYLPWRGSTVTDFKVGADRLDFGQLFRDAGYTGTDPEADGLISYKYQSGLQIYFDPDGSGTGQWPFLITTLQGVPANTYRWAELSGGGASPPPSGGATLGFGSNAGSGTFAEGSSGARTLGFGVHRSGDTSGPASVEWSVTGVGSQPADAADFGAAEMPHGVVNFAPGEVYKNVVLTVVGDTEVEPDEQFAVELFNPQGATLSGVIRSVQTMTNDDGPAPPPPPSGDGQVLTARQTGDTLTGGAGADTLNASQGPDRLTGGGGDDHFVFGKLVWNAGVITDFAPGHDQVELSGLFDTYPGGVVETRLNAGATEVYFDPDGAGGEWPSRITTLSGVTPDQLGSGWLIQ